MRAVWLVAACLLVAGCGTQQPAPPPDSTDETPDAGNDSDAGADEGGSRGDGATNDSDGDAATGDGDTSDQEDETLDVTSPAFDDGETIPTEHTADGADTSPPLNVTGVPADAETLALVVDDPDAPREEPWVHWLVWNAPADAGTIPEGYPPSGDGEAFPSASQGNNSFPRDNQRYRGPAPPEGDDPHRYRFTLYALDSTLELKPGANRTQLDAAVDGHVLERARLVGLYGR